MLASIVVDEIEGVVKVLVHEIPHAFAVIQGQQCNCRGYAIATFPALKRTFESYLRKRYRYHELLGLSDVIAIGSWLKWANPDDAWHHFDFRDQTAVREFLRTGGRDDEVLRFQCIQELRKASMQNSNANITLGLTYGQDPTDFLRSVVEIYGERGDNNVRDEFGLLQRLDPDICRASQKSR